METIEPEYGDSVVIWKMSYWYRERASFQEYTDNREGKPWFLECPWWAQINIGPSAISEFSEHWMKSREKLPMKNVGFFENIKKFS